MVRGGPKYSSVLFQWSAAVRRSHVEALQKNPDHGVIADGADQLHGALLAELLDRLVVAGLAQPAGIHDLIRNLVSHAFVVLFEVWRPVVADGFADFGRDALQFGLRCMRRPRVLHRSGPAHGDDAKLENPPADGAVIAERDAELVGVLGELRIAQPYRERPAHGLPLAGN